MYAEINDHIAKKTAIGFEPDCSLWGTNFIELLDVDFDYSISEVFQMF